MELTKLTENVSQISELGTYPRADNNLTIEQLKAWFDKAPEMIKTYLNEELVPELERKLTSFDNRVSIAEEKIDDFEQGTGFLSIVGGTMEGPLNVLTPTEDDNAANKAYVDAKHFTATATLPASGWSSSAPYTQTVTVAGVETTDNPHISPVYSDTLATAITQKEAWEAVSKAVTAEGAITFSCFEDKPTTDIPIQVEVNR